MILQFSNNPFRLCNNIYLIKIINKITNKVINKAIQRKDLIVIKKVLKKRV